MSAASVAAKVRLTAVVKVVVAPPVIKTEVPVGAGISAAAAGVLESVDAVSLVVAVASAAGVAELSGVTRVSVETPLQLASKASIRLVKSRVRGSR